MKVILIGLFALLAACAARPVDPAFATPTCESERECDVKWRAAESWIVHRAGRPIVERTGTMMRTNMDQSGANHLSVQVEKKPREHGGYDIEATMYCARRVGCEPTPWQALQQFNRAVNSAWKVRGRDDTPAGGAN